MFQAFDYLTWRSGRSEKLALETQRSLTNQRRSSKNNGGDLGPGRPGSEQEGLVLSWCRFGFSSTIRASVVLSAHTPVVQCHGSLLLSHIYVLWKLCPCYAEMMLFCIKLALTPGVWCRFAETFDVFGSDLFQHQILEPKMKELVLKLEPGRARS